MRLNAKQIAEFTGGTFIVNPIDPAQIMEGITWDSRDVKPLDLYVALPGARVDGHDFVKNALNAGAAGALVMHPLDSKTELLAKEYGAAIIEVSHTPTAITDLARAWRKFLKGHIIALTGSTGKTTTKNLIRDVVKKAGSVVATKANQNNELGVPKTLLSADPTTNSVIVEMGMRGEGQISELCEMVRPQWGLITNIGESHIELLGSRDNIAKAKDELFCSLPDGFGKAFVNASDEYADFLIRHAALKRRGIECVRFSPSKITPGTLDGPGVWAQDVELDGEGRPLFLLCAEGFKCIGAQSGSGVAAFPVHLGLRGIHNVSNACAAAAVGLELGIPIDAIAAALESSLPETGRQEMKKAREGYIVINDTYNANPDSMKAALSTFRNMKVEGRRIAVLGDMGELGDYSKSCHLGVGKAAASGGIDLLICIGNDARWIAQGAKDNGMDAASVACVDSIGEVLAILEDEVGPKDAVLVKASRFMGLERIVDGLVS
ncbi:MAG: UDP-N-acetylmuramoyl-tripeptide--D-alanyl-D-alanine ligase [Eggerthellaceae bacterium]|nr:UDP-N-acetylmuramoyl-tripeptide--D-alanyl-D-alanine ligase [Eggerthellaceae bacterium]